jgi:hypothetical protein
MRRMLREKAPPGFLRSKGGHWRVSGAVTKKRLCDIQRFYGLGPDPEMTLDKLREFDAFFAEMTEWSKSCADAERVAEAHPLIGPIYRCFKQLEVELAITPEELRVVREFILQARNVSPLDKDFWKLPQELVPDEQRQLARKYPKKFIIYAALQSMRNRHQPPPTIAKLASELGVNRTTLFRWASGEQINLQSAINVVFELNADWGCASPHQAADLRRQHFGRKR